MPATTQTLRPGERLLHGEVHVFNSDMLNDHCAAEAIENCPADVSGLTVGELTSLHYDCLRQNLRFHPMRREVCERVLSALSARGQRDAFVKPVVLVQNRKVA